MDGDDVAGNLDRTTVTYQFMDGDDVAGNLDKTTVTDETRNTHSEHCCYSRITHAI